MPLLLLVSFLGIPLLEIWVIIQVGQVIGALPTIALLLAESAFGAWLVKREGLRAWRAFNGALTGGRLPDREVADGALVLVGGALLLTPGFVTDVAGFLCVLPPTRPLVRRGLVRLAGRRARRLAGTGPGRAGGGPGGRGGGYAQTVQGEVVDDDRARRSRPDQ